MQVLSEEEVAKWFKRFDSVGVESDYAHIDEDGLFFTHPEASCIDLEYPTKLERLPFFAHCLATIGYDDQHFDGAMIWFENWGLWNLYDEGIGYRIVERINHAAGQPKSFEVGPGHQFRADELSDAIGLLMQPMIFGWDSFYLPRWSYGTGEFFLRISHGSFVTLVTRTKAFHEQVFQNLEKLDLGPKRATDQRMKRFCHPMRS